MAEGRPKREAVVLTSRTRASSCWRDQEAKAPPFSPPPPPPPKRLANSAGVGLPTPSVGGVGGWVGGWRTTLPEATSTSSSSRVQYHTLPPSGAREKKMSPLATPRSLPSP